MREGWMDTRPSDLPCNDLRLAAKRVSLIDFADLIGRVFEELVV
jgi:hypothetical protein